LSKITDVDQKEILEQNQMLDQLLIEQQAEWRVERTRMLIELDLSGTIDRPENPGSQSTLFETVDPLRYCGVAKSLHKFLQTLQSNFASHKHLFPTGDPDSIQYPVSCLDPWNYHPDTTQ